MYSASGIANNSASVRSGPALVFHAFATFGSTLATGRSIGVLSGSATCFAGAKRSVKLPEACVGTRVAVAALGADAGAGAGVALRGAGFLAAGVVTGFS